MRMLTSFCASATFLLCVFVASFLFLVWPFPTVAELSHPVLFFRYLYGAWAACIAAVGVWAWASGRSKRDMRAKEQRPVAPPMSAEER